MYFRIADTFTDSLARLNGEEQKAVKTTAFDLQLNPANPGMKFHKLDKARDKNFWSVRVSSDLRIIVHKTSDSLLLCYVAHHDDAYLWAVRRKLETHPKTGAAQLVEIRERVEEIQIPKYAEAVKHAPVKYPLFANLTIETLLGYGVPEEWLEDVRSADEDTILELADHLPGEAAEALLELATGGRPVTIPAIAAIPELSLQLSRDNILVAPAASEFADPFNHADSLRRFRVMNSVEELERAMDYPWEKWTIFLHPSQRDLVERSYSGPMRVSGSAGTGKTIVALHRAVFLARSNPDARILLTTFSETLASALRTKLRRLIGNEPRLGERLEVHAINSIGQRLYELSFERPRIASRGMIQKLLKTSAAKAEGHKFSLHFVLTEWEEIVDAWQLEGWEEYRDVRRLGRKTRLPEQQRSALWAIFERVRSELKSQGVITVAGMFNRLAPQMERRKNPPFDFVVIDEAQDVSIAQLRFLAGLGADRPNSLFFAGDLGQRIFQQPFSWKSCGVDIQGRARSLHINYRTSHQIRMQADRLLGAEVSDVDGNTEDRRGTVSVFNGPAPIIKIFESIEEEIAGVAAWLADQSKEGILPHEIAVFVRSSGELERACDAVKSSFLPGKVLDENVEITHGYASICTMHLAKGLEFRAVAVMACDDEIIPFQERIESVSDDSDLKEVYDTERHLLYVACTRARDHLFVSAVEPASEFLDDLRM